MKYSVQITLRHLLLLVLLAALATGWLRERLSHHGLQMRIERLEYDISVLAMIITRNRLTIPEQGEFSAQHFSSPALSLQDDYTKDALSHPPY
jgi:hypothetical protein